MRQGFVKNFLSLACDPSRFSFLMITVPYCDQDDVGELEGPGLPSRSSRSVRAGHRLSPAMYCSRTMLIFNDGRTLGHRRAYRRKPRFRYALCAQHRQRQQHPLSRRSCMPVDDDLRQRGKSAVARLVDVSVDQRRRWRSLLRSNSAGPATACMAKTSSAPIPGYATASAGALQALRRGRFQLWSDMNVAALELFRPYMTSENRALFNLFGASRQRSFFGRQIGFFNSGVSPADFSRQSRIGRRHMGEDAGCGRQN